MNNLSSYDMLARSLKDEKNEYINNFKNAQKQKEAETSLAYESITAPFIEATGLNLLKKGVKYGGSKLGFSDDQMNSLEDIGNTLKKGDVSGALDKARLMGRDKLMSVEQKKFLQEQLGKFKQLKEGVTDIPTNIRSVASGEPPAPPAGSEIEMTDLNPNDFSTEPVTNEESTFSTLSKQLDKQVPRVELPVAPKPPPLRSVSRLRQLKQRLKGIKAKGQSGIASNNDDPLDITYDSVDPFSGQTITKAKPIIQTPQEPVIDPDTGKVMPDETDVLRAKLESTDFTDASPAEISDAQTALKSYIGKTQAPEEPSTFQSAMDFLSQKKGSASAKWGRKPAEMDDMSNYRPTNEPLSNPRDVAPDIKIPERADYLRPGQIRISSKPKSVRFKPEVDTQEAPKAPQTIQEQLEQLKVSGTARAKEPALAEPSLEADTFPYPAPPPRTEPFDIDERDIQTKFSQLSQEGRENYINDVTDEAEKNDTTAKEVPLETKNSIVDEHLSQDQLTGRGLADPDIEGTKDNVKNIKQVLTGRYNNLSQDGKDLADEAGESLADQYSIRRISIPNNRLENIISMSEQQDDEEQQEKPQQEEEKQDDEETPPVEEKPVVEPDKPPPPSGDDDPSLGSKLTKASEDVGEDVAEGGGIEDPISDIVALGTAVGVLFGGLSKAHQNSDPPALLQVNPTYQLGQGQE